MEAHVLGGCAFIQKHSCESPVRQWASPNFCGPLDIVSQRALNAVRVAQDLQHLPVCEDIHYSRGLVPDVAAKNEGCPEDGVERELSSALTYAEVPLAARGHVRCVEVTTTMPLSNANLIVDIREH
eukprot:CAMPEP_0115168076 /NCGR_PEP_ID=MMETSP0270-20121206/559_1 /TAXON_ID=71861 /ORGANISM="Scrippsiella trochoidea, Strain CCMP3099" /LENGTH=125 /DNA_ID=CAMNT_0002580717 /DNA_START=218 /DNA_END=595 /DNA_ORIENTATION=+